MAMTEIQLKDFYGGESIWDEFTEEERLFLFELHRGGNHRIPPDIEEQRRREALWKSITEKKDRLIRSRRRGHV